MSVPTGTAAAYAAEAFDPDRSGSKTTGMSSVYGVNVPLASSFLLSARRRSFRGPQSHAEIEAANCDHYLHKNFVLCVSRSAYCR
ncbi:hypothetical protein [Azospirillum griseum]|uniref:hypothetical protein n=1 Tax=Azospirillum griseum TaxID=2496639 RepID=UPI00157755AC|nr:hypothetical protein [Azospirillum griseum]